ncbi:oligopeptide transport system substrate-binding protein [Fontibacillus panacisegetis]|uniref:Oligopeptide transport system substrate-binding protein n=1 Tax=Fontibacillus panacisegetis TaxID=670482 RepID=A0A1G7M0A2_9BACL|nr:peptide ABC transporter substrate-binding protein [Fontibacillus panacisegetis]SDF55113.1 oligopeptide transport system substrate-binding protein [Fontibacillus panacisegetis]
MKTNWKLGLLLLILVLGTVLSGCGSNKTAESSNTKSNNSTASETNAGKEAETTPQEPQILNWIIVSELPTADSVKSYDTLSSSQIEIFAEGLYKIDGNNKTVPVLATGDPVISEDGLTYSIKLRDGLKWPNGDPLTAKDFVFAWQRLFNPATAAQNASTHFNIKNAQAINEGKKAAEELGIEAVSDTELKITLEYPDTYFTASLSSVNLYPQNEAFVTEKGEAYGTNSENTLGNGPFILKDWDGTGLNWSFIKNEQYWDKDNIKLDKINIQVVKEIGTGINLYESGAVDVASLSGEYISQYTNNPEYLSVLTLTASNLELGISSNKALQNENFRKAISLVINRDELVNNVLIDGSNPLTGIVPKGIAVNPDTGTDFSDEAGAIVVTDVEEGKRLWELAKKELGTDKVKLELITSDTDTAKKTSQYLQSQLETNLSGVTIELSNVPTKVRFEKMMSYKFDLALGGWTGDFDPVSYLNLFFSTYEHNHARYKDETYDALITKIKTEDATDPQTRWKDLQEAQKYILSKAVVTPLYQGASNYLVKSKVKGIVTHNLGTPLEITRAYIEQNSAK